MNSRRSCNEAPPRPAAALTFAAPFRPPRRIAINRVCRFWTHWFTLQLLPAHVGNHTDESRRYLYQWRKIYGVALLEDRLGTYLTQRRFETSLLTGFSLLALLMAAVGIYGLIQYSVATRTQEIGLRMALGAQAGDIFRMIIGEGLTLSLTGVGLGFVGAWWLGRAGSSLLFGVSATDPLTLMTVALVLTAVALAACYVPARHG